MAWYNDKGDFTDLLGDPGGYITGANKEGAGGIKKMLFGDPEAIKAAYDKAMAMSQQMGRESKDFLMGQQGKAQQYFAPISNLFQSMYGTQGIQGPQVPQGTQGMGPLAQMYGAR